MSNETESKPKFPPSEKMTTKSLTRHEMVEILNRGESVMHNGTVISDHAELPTSAELAKGDPAKEQAVASELQAQMAELQKQMAELQRGATAPVSVSVSDESGKEATTPGLQTVADKAQELNTATTNEAQARENLKNATAPLLPKGK